MAGHLTEHAALLRWAAEAGGELRVEPGVFEGGLRGLAATQDLLTGDVALSVPQSLLISAHTAATSSLGQAISALGVLDSEAIQVIWTMVDRHDPESEHSQVWMSLPACFCTGLSIPDSLLEGLFTGTVALHHFQAARQHVRTSYVEVRPVLDALLAAYPDHIQAHMVSWENYIYSVELWYSYGLEVDFGDGKALACLVPVAYLFNHGAGPHITAYGALHVGTGHLRFPMARPCSARQQVFLSYGSLPSLDTLLFYGFCLPDNPHDFLQLGFEQAEGAEDAGLQQRKLKLLASRGIKGCEVRLCQGPTGVSQTALATLQVALASEEELDRLEQQGQVPTLGKQKRDDVCELLQDMAEAMAQALEHADSCRSGYKDGTELARFIDAAKLFYGSQLQIMADTEQNLKDLLEHAPQNA